MSDPTHSNTEAGVVAELVRKANTPELLKEGVGSNSVVIFPDKTIKSLEIYADRPKRKRAAVALIDTGSFIEYLSTHKIMGQTTVFGLATEQGGTFNAVLDYHDADESKPDAANWGEHTATLTLATTPEWRRWTAKSGELMSQEAFAEFIEDNLNDIVKPEAAAILDIAQLLVAKKTVNFKSGKRLSNGETKLEYVETIEATGGKTSDTLAIPDSFVLGIVPFVGADGVEITARLRYRISDSGKLSFAFVLNRPFKVIENAFTLARAAIEEKTGLTVHIGSGKVTPPPSA